MKMICRIAPVAGLMIVVGMAASCRRTISVQAEDVAARPDSALMVLLEMDSASLKTNRERADYALFLSMALDKCYIDIASDSIIAPAVQFYERHLPLRNQMLTAYYQGRVLYNAGDVTGAVPAYERAEALAKKLNDDFYLGLIYRNISLLYESTYNTSRMVDYTEKSRDAFHRANALLYETGERMTLASALGNDGRHVESIAQFDNLLADPQVDSLSRMMIFPYYARELVKAGICDQKTISLYEQGDSSSYISSDFGAWAYCCWKVGDVSTGKTLMETALQRAEDETTRAVLAFYQYKCSLLEGNYKEALSYLETATETEDQIAREKLAESVDAARSAYAQKVLSDKEARMKRARIIFGACLLLALSALIGIQIRRRKEQRETMARMDEIQESLSRSAEKNKTLVNAVLLEQVTALRLLSDEYENSDDALTKERFFRVFKKRLGEFRQQDADLSLLESSVNEFRDGAMALLREEFPDGTRNFFRLSAMFFAGLPYDVMSLLTKSTVPTLKSGKSQIKKKIAESQAPHRELFLTLLDSAAKRPAGRPPKGAR